MAPRANWKGYLKVAELSCPVSLYTAASTSDRIAFHTINRATGHRVMRQFIDSDSGKPVEKDDQVKGYEVGSNDYIVLEPEEVAAAIPESDKTLNVEAFVPFDQIDDLYFDKPYYLTPGDKHGQEAFALIREGLKAKKVAAFAQTVLFRRVRTLLIRPDDAGLLATTLQFNYAVRSVKEAFDDVPDMKIKGEMLELAKHIIDTKRGSFDPSKYTDRYESALAELVKAKLEGKAIPTRKPQKSEKVVDLMQALLESAGMMTKQAAPKKAAGTKTKAEPARRKAS
ncbi:MAG: Ku protein [Phyllobacterium sp.]|uniref:non-homologous end joining protein Ku n=1 Tax=Phyllobacterium sp. TaxID=1871046 RepID=UPI0030F09460